MAARFINQFMWGYQGHYAHAVHYLAERVLQEIGADSEVQVFLVGVRRPGSKVAHSVCLEPEQGPWPQALFVGLDAEVEAEIPKHPLSSMFYGDEASMRDKPEWTRQAVIREQVTARLKPFDDANLRQSFVVTPGVVGEYDIAIVLQVPRATLAAHAELTGQGWDGEIYPLSFIRRCLGQVLEEAVYELARPEPGRSVRSGVRDAREIVQRAARGFLHGVLSNVDRRLIGDDYFDHLSEISGLRYEGDEGLGRLAFVSPATEGTSFVLKLDEPVALRQARWARKLLQMASADLPLVATPNHILGLGRIQTTADEVVAVDFHGHQDWELRRGETLLMRSQLGRPRLPQEAVPEVRFLDNVARLFPEIHLSDRLRLWDALRQQTRQQHGSLLVVARDAAEEAKRLTQQCTPITPTLLTPDVLTRASRIDGGLLLDPSGVCHAIGVVFDGPTHEACLPSRGARYNSAVRYVHADPTARMAIVYSDDRTLDIVPLLRPQVSRARLADAVAELQATDLEGYYAPRAFLDKHRFYLSAEQCAAVNAALVRLYETPAELGEIRFVTDPFEPHPEMNDGYLR